MKPALFDYSAPPPAAEAVALRAPDPAAPPRQGVVPGVGANPFQEPLLAAARQVQGPAVSGTNGARRHCDSGLRLTKRRCGP